MTRRPGPPPRPRRKATPFIAGRTAEVPRRAPWLAAAAAMVVLVVIIGIALLSSFGGSDEAPPPAPPGTTDRASWVLVPTGRSRAQVSGLLGPPLRTRERAGDPAGSECWLYAARSGRALTYELCFRGDFLSEKSILPYRP